MHLGASPPSEPHANAADILGCKRGPLCAKHVLVCSNPALAAMHASALMDLGLAGAPAVSQSWLLGHEARNTTGCIAKTGAVTPGVLPLLDTL